MNPYIVTIWTACDCNEEVEIDVHTLNGSTECNNCGRKDQLGQRELFELLMNLED
jgi:hypothetical protein